MRCKADNRPLTQWDMTRKDKFGNYLWLCSRCHSIMRNYNTFIPSETTEVSDESDNLPLDDALDQLPFESNVSDYDGPITSDDL